MKQLEIERKFLLKEVPQIKGHTRELLIDQFYVTIDDKRVRFRRVIEEGQSDKYEKIIKTRLSAGMSEEEWLEVNKKDYDEFFKKKEKHVSKIRFVYEANGLKFEIDRFLNISLVLCEVELVNLDQKIEFPDYIKKMIIKEVTLEKEFSNYNLGL